MEGDLQVIAILVWSKLRAILAADPVSPHCIFALELAFPGDLLQSSSAHHIVVFDFADEEKNQKDIGSVCLHVDLYRSFYMRIPVYIILPRNSCGTWYPDPLFYHIYDIAVGLDKICWHYLCCH